MKALASALMISATLIAGAAQAASLNDAPKTRAQVVAELQQARAQGQLSNGELDYPPAIAQASTKSRAQVQQELAAAQAAGQIQVGEDTSYPVIAASGPSTVTRAQVEAEYTQLAASGQLPQVAF